MTVSLCSVFLPGVSLAGKDSLHEGLWWHPFDWQHGTSSFPVITGSGRRKSLVIRFRKWVSKTGQKKKPNNFYWQNKPLKLIPYFLHLPNAVRTQDPRRSIFINHPECFATQEGHRGKNVASKPVNISCHSKISNFSHSVWSRAGEQAVSGSDVSEKVW